MYDAGETEIREFTDSDGMTLTVRKEPKPPRPSMVNSDGSRTYPKRAEGTDEAW